MPLAAIPRTAAEQAATQLETREDATVDLTVRLGERDEVDRLEPAWRDLGIQHEGLAEMPPTRPADESWERRRRRYLDWLARDDHLLVVAEDGGQLVGYAVVSIGGGPATWDLGEVSAELETLAVREAFRGQGIGKALIEAAEDRAREAGAAGLFVGVAHSNADAIRFYRREGFTAFYVSLMKPVGGDHGDAA